MKEFIYQYGVNIGLLTFVFFILLAGISAYKSGKKH